MPLHGYGGLDSSTDAPSETTVHLRTKSSALHIEQAERPAKRLRSIEVDKGHLGLATVTERAIATPTENSETTSYRSKPLSITSKEEVVLSKDDENSRPATASSSQTARTPTPVRDFPAEPKLWVDDGPGAGKETADWRRKFVPVLHEAFGAMTTEERTRKFDKLVEKNSDRYTTAIATYYTEYPEHIPDEDLHPPSDSKRRKWKAAFEGGPDLVQQSQERLFKNWHWDSAGRENQPEPPHGPKDESSPDEPPPECRHCVRKATRKRRQQVLKPFIAPITIPIRTLKRAASKGLIMKSKTSQQDLSKPTVPPPSLVNPPPWKETNAVGTSQASGSNVLTPSRREALRPEVIDGK